MLRPRRARAVRRDRPRVRGDRGPYARYLAELATHQFAACPRGNGIDTHRLWESLYLGVVPIVERSPHTEYWEHLGLPLLLVDRWDEVTPDLLRDRVAAHAGRSTSWRAHLRLSYYRTLVTESAVALRRPRVTTTRSGSRAPSSPAPRRDEARPGPLDVLIPSQRLHARLLPRVIEGLRRFVDVGRIHVVVLAQDDRHFRQRLDAAVQILHPEDLIPDMTRARLRRYPLAYFPRRAGWYHQQFVKLAFAMHGSADGHYLAWDADTIPLRRIELFDGEGRMLFNRADEHHPPYFANYTRLLGFPARREFSFVSEFAVMDRAIVREMVGRIERRFPGPGSWAWKILANLRGTSISLFSEYETYGHYVKDVHPGRADFRPLPWHRTVRHSRSFVPSRRLLDELAERYSYATFEIYP